MAVSENQRAEEEHSKVERELDLDRLVAIVLIGLLSILAIEIVAVLKFC